jgi:hypothetical protein
MPTYFPLSGCVPQYADLNGKPYSGAVLKAYADGTSTPILIATDYTGTTTVGSVALNASGYPVVSGNVVIPHVSENYKLALYPDATAAASNTGAIWTIDNNQVSSTVSSGSLTDVASAASVNLNSTATDYFNITGSTTITGIVLAEGVQVTVKFAGSLTITHSAFLINIGGINIQTAVGDIAVFRGEAGGVVRMLDYQRVSSLSGITQGTVVASTSGTAIDFTGIPAGTKQVTLMLSGISTTVSDNLVIQIGDSGGIETTGYDSSGSSMSASTISTFDATQWFRINTNSATSPFSGTFVLNLLDPSSNTWTIIGGAQGAGTNSNFFTSGAKSLSATLDRIRLTTVGGAGTFDAGKVNIQYQ